MHRSQWPARRTRSRWTPARLLLLGALLGFGPVVLDASVALDADLALLAGAAGPVPGWLWVLDSALVDLLVPLGLFFVLAGVLFAVRSRRPPGRSVAFRAALGGAEFNLAAGLLVGLLRFSLGVLPPELITVGLLRNAVVALFLGTVAAAAGLLVALVGTAAVAREPAVGPGPKAVRVRTPRGKSIYRAELSPVTVFASREVIGSLRQW